MAEGHSEFPLPPLGGGATEATIVRWSIDVGDRVVIDRPICSVDANGVVLDLTSPFAGTVTALGAAAGQALAVGEMLVAVADDRPTAGPTVLGPVAPDVSQDGDRAHPDDPAHGTVDDEEEDPAAHRDAEGEDPGAHQDDEGEDPAAHQDAEGPGGDGARPRYSPLVRRLADEFGVDLDHIEGTGPGGRITRDDVHRAAFPDEPLPGQGADDPTTDDTLGADRDPDDTELDPDDTLGADRDPDDTELDPDDTLGADLDPDTELDPDDTLGADRDPDTELDPDDTLGADRDPDDTELDPGSAPEPDIEPAAAPESEREGPGAAVEPAPAASPVSVDASVPVGRAPAALQPSDAPLTGARATFSLMIEVEGRQLVRAHERLGRRAGVGIGLDALLLKLIAPAVLPVEELRAGSDLTLGFLRPSESGLVADVVAGVDRLSLAEIERVMNERVADHERGAEPRVAPLTVLDAGALGVTATSPPLPAGCSAVVALGEVRAGSGDVLTLAGSFDERVIDLVQAATFLNALRPYLEDPVLAFTG